MANYTAANLVKAQIALNAEFATPERRFNDPVVFNLYNSTDARRMFPNYEMLKTAVNRVIEANYFLRTAQALSTGGFTHDHTGANGDSGTITPTWIPYTRDFSMTLKQANISTWTWQQEFDDNMLNTIADFAEGLDEVASADLFANRTQVNVAATRGTFNGVTEVYEIVESTDGDDAIQISKVVMSVNKYKKGWMFDVVCDTNSFTKFEKQANQGTGNSTNLSFQFSGVNFILDTTMDARAIALTYTTGFWVFVPRGTVSSLPWIPIQNRQSVTTKENEYGMISNPVDGLTYAVHHYVERADGTAKNGQTQDVNNEWEVGIFLALEHAPLSVATETTIYAFGYT